MFNYKILNVKTVDFRGREIPIDVQLSAENVIKSSAELAANLPDYWDAGTLIHDAGYVHVKEKALDGTWVEVNACE